MAEYTRGRDRVDQALETRAHSVSGVEAPVPHELVAGFEIDDMSLVGRIEDTQYLFLRLSGMDPGRTFGVVAVTVEDKAARLVSFEAALLIANLEALPRSCLDRIN